MTATFLGLSLNQVTTNLGWNSQPSQLIATVVEDTEEGQSWSPPTLGTPATFELGSLTFRGLLKKYTKNRSERGTLYSVTLEDPRAILEGTQVILSSYYGSINIYNLLNVYGYLENLLGFGGSQANEAGVPYWLVKQAIHELTALPVQGPFGGPLVFRGVSYNVDIDDLPNPPIYYRIGGTSISLMDLISLICTDGGYDFFVTLVGNTIKVRTVSRQVQAPLGTISNIVDNTDSGLVISSEVGIETRNETTSAFLVGGPVTTLHVESSGGITPFYGLSYNGEIAPVYLANIDGLGSGITAQVNASAVSDVLGNVTYELNENEMRFALANYESWSTYMFYRKAEQASGIGIINLYKNVVGDGNALAKADLINNLASHPQNAAQAAALGNTAQIRSQRMYEFVKSYAQDYMGKKFFVKIPYLTRKLDLDTLDVVTSHEVTDAAFIPQSGTFSYVSGVYPQNVLGLSNYNADIFKLPDGRYTAFAKYTNLFSDAPGSGVDLSAISPNDTAIEGSGTLFVKCSVDSQILFPSATGGISVTGYPGVVITMPNPLLNEPRDNFGDSTLIGRVINGFETIQPNSAFGTIPHNVAPSYRIPNYVVIPLKSNVLRYGPWYIQGQPGQVQFIYDESLVPWNFGGYLGLQNAAASKIANAVTNLQVNEAGSIELAELPRASLGDTLVAGGPNLTNISITYGEGGYTTSYRMETFTQRFGTFSKDNVERLRRNALTAQELEKKTRQSLRSRVSQAITAQKAYGGFKKEQPKFLQKQTPHEMVVARLIPNTGDGTFRCGASLCTTEEAFTHLGVHNTGLYQRAAAASLASLVVPYSVVGSPSGHDYMPHFPSILSTVPVNTDQSHLNPLRGQEGDIEMHTWGPSFSGSIRGQDYITSDGRSIALRGPIVVAGWGEGIDLQTYPTGVTSAKRYKTSNKWPAGPVDLLWDKYRGVWTSHDILAGTTSGSIPAGGYGYVNVYSNQPALQVYNQYSTSISGNTKCHIGYCMNLHLWEIIAADCAS